MDKKCEQKSLVINFPKYCVGNICRFWSTKFNECYLDMEYMENFEEGIDPMWNVDNQDCGHE